MEKDNDALQVFGSVIVFIILCFIGYILISKQFKNESMVLIQWVYNLLLSKPILTWTLFDQQIEYIVRVYTSSKIYLDDGMTMSRINASLQLFQVPIVFLFLFFCKRYFLLTKPATFKYTIKGVEGLVNIKKEIYPQVEIGYDFAKKGMKSLYLQSWGRFSMEYGPIRWAIRKNLIYSEGKPVAFNDFKKQAEQLFGSNTQINFLNDDFDEMSLYAGKLDLDLELLFNELKLQMGRKFKSIDDLPDIYIALSVLFLLFAKGKAGKKKAIAYKYKLARAVKYSKIETDREKLVIDFDRKLGLTQLETLLKETNSKLIEHSKYEMLFVLSCYSVAQTNNGDITPPDIQWLMPFDREMYLLLHCYSGSPDITNNSPYIEVLAPMQAWLLQYSAVKEDNENPALNKMGFIESSVGWVNLYQSSLINFTQTFDKRKPYFFKEKNRIKLVKSSFTDIENFVIDSKKFSKSIRPSDQNRIVKILGDLKVNNIDDQLLILSIQVISHVLNETIKEDRNKLADYFLDNISWIYNLNSALFFQIFTLVNLSVDSGILPIDVIRNLKKGVDATTDARFNSLVNLYVDSFIKIESIAAFKLQKPEFHSNDSKFDKEDFIALRMQNPSDFVPVSVVMVNILQYLERTKASKFTSNQLIQLSDIPYIAIRQSLKSFLLHMTLTEKWLKPKYLVTEAKFIGTPELKEISES